jgi:CRISPR system Cascade subunit CasD
VTVLLMRLAGPLQAWGASSRFAYRHTEIAPTKSGVIGMLAAAKGIRRTEPLTELLDLSFGVRLDQPGRLVRDFQVARSLDERHAMPLTYRYYLADAVFLAAVGADRNLLDGLHEALSHPAFALYLGRRSCPPAGPISLGVHSGTVAERLADTPWQAAIWYRNRARQTVRLEVLRDAAPDEPITDTIRDAPISFDPAYRQHAWRAVVRSHIDLANPRGRPLHDHDPFVLLGG